MDGVEPGIAGRVKLVDAVLTIDGNLLDTVTDVDRTLERPSLVGAIRYPRLSVAPIVPSEAELEGARRLWELHDGTDTELTTELYDV